MKGIYRLNIDCGRMGDVEGVFVADSKDVADIIGKYVYFGEILGKHSEIEGNIEESEITLLTDNGVAVAVVEKYNLSTGYNPFDYLGENEEEED